MKKINLAFLINFNHKKWLGGLNIILNLANFIAENKKLLNHNINVILITRNDDIKKDFKISNKIKIIHSKKLIEMSLLKRILEKVFLIFFGKTLILENFLKKHNIDYLSHTNIVTGNRSVCKSLVWIPDFQYLHLQHLFTFKYKLFKKINLYLYSTHAYKILLSSNDAKKDLKKLIKVHPKKIFVNKFVFSIKNPKNLPKINNLKKKFKIEKKYIYLPNQYWVHKNHITILKALNYIGTKTLKKYKVQVISTGFNNDYRDPNHFTNIMNYIKKKNLKQFYNYLGLVKYDEVLSLIFYSQCIINPSIFEGWSSTVEQAKSYKKNLILSNIGVHLEQKPEYSKFFNPKNHKKLAKLILNIYKNKNPYKQKFNFKTIEKELNLKIFDYSKKFCKKIK